MRKLFNFFKKSNDGRYSLYSSMNRQSKNSVSAQEGLNYNEISLYLNKGINKRGEKVGETTFILKDKRGNILENHEILNLLDKPNKTQTGDQFWKMASIYKDASGFVVIQKIGNDAVFRDNKKITELKLLNPAFTTINYNEDRTAIKSFTYAEPLGGQKTDIPFEECIYWYNPDPKNIHEGISIITAGLKSILTDLEMSEYQYGLMKSGGGVDSVLSFKNTLTKEQLTDIKDKYIQEYGKTSKAGIPMILGGDASYTRIALNPKELAYLESKGIVTDDITIITGVPSAILGVTTGETFSNAEIAYKIFLRETIKPLVRDLVNVLDWRLVPKDLELDFIDPTPEDTEMKLKVLQTGSDVNALTINEKREMLGLDPIAGQDEIIDPNQPPKEKAGIFVHPLKNKDFRKVYHSNYIKSLNSAKLKFKRELEKYFKSQEKRIINQIQARKQVKKKELVDDIFDSQLEYTLALPLLETLKQIAKESGQEVMDAFASGRNYDYGTAIDTAVNKRFDFFAKNINETTAKDLKKEVSQWLDGNENISQLVDRVQEVYKGIETWRAETIVNTEVATITQEAKVDSYKQIGISTKIWVWSPGIKGGVRHEHKHIDGEEKPLNMSFSNGLLYPHDPSADAGEVINCECTI